MKIGPFFACFALLGVAQAEQAYTLSVVSSAKSPVYSNTVRFDADLLRSDEGEVSTYTVKNTSMNIRQTDLLLDPEKGRLVPQPAVVVLKNGDGLLAGLEGRTIQILRARGGHDVLRDETRDNKVVGPVSETILFMILDERRKKPFGVPLAATDDIRACAHAAAELYVTPWVVSGTRIDIYSVKVKSPRGGWIASRYVMCHEAQDLSLEVRTADAPPDVLRQMDALVERPLDVGAKKGCVFAQPAVNARDVK